METSTDLEAWGVWNVPGNLLTVPAENRLRTFTVPRDETRRFFRFKLEEP
jgi:hypothetical protein